MIALQKPQVPHVHDRALTIICDNRILKLLAVDSEQAEQVRQTNELVTVFVRIPRKGRDLRHSSRRDEQRNKCHQVFHHISVLVN